MAGLISVELSGMRFFSRHGLFAEEKQIGNEFVVELVLSWEAPTAPIVHLEDTINYVPVYDLVKKYMDQPTPLLETVIMQIADALKVTYPQLKKITISLQKLYPPIVSFQGSVGVKLERSFDY